MIKIFAIFNTPFLFVLKSRYPHLAFAFGFFCNGICLYYNKCIVHFQAQTYLNASARLPSIYLLNFYAFFQKNRKIFWNSCF